MTDHILKIRRDDRTRRALAGFCFFFVVWPVVFFVAALSGSLGGLDIYHGADIVFRMFPIGLIGSMMTLGLFNFLQWYTT